MVIDIINNETNLQMIRRLLLALSLCNDLQRERDIEEFKKKFRNVKIDHLIALSQKLQKGQIDGSSWTIREIPMFDRINDSRVDILYGDFFATIGEEVRFMRGYTSDINSDSYLPSYEAFESEYRSKIKVGQGQWVDLMRKIKPGQTPDNDETVKSFHQAVEELLSVKLRRKNDERN